MLKNVVIVPIPYSSAKKWFVSCHFTTIPIAKIIVLSILTIENLQKINTILIFSEERHHLRPWCAAWLRNLK